MEFTQNSVWQGIYKILPEYKTVMENKMQVNLPEALKSAAIAFFMEDNKPIFMKVVATYEYNYAKILVHSALAEIKEKGYIEFGQIEITLD